MIKSLHNDLFSLNWKTRYAIARNDDVHARAQLLYSFIYMYSKPNFNFFCLMMPPLPPFFAVSPPRRASSNHDGMQSLSFYDFTVRRVALHPTQAFSRHFVGILIKRHDVHS